MTLVGNILTEKNNTHMEWSEISALIWPTQAFVLTVICSSQPMYIYPSIAAWSSRVIQTHFAWQDLQTSFGCHSLSDICSLLVLHSTVNLLLCITSISATLYCNIWQETEWSFYQVMYWQIFPTQMHIFPPPPPPQSWAALSLPPSNSSLLEFNLCQWIKTNLWTSKLKTGNCLYWSTKKKKPAQWTPILQR